LHADRNPILGFRNGRCHSRISAPWHPQISLAKMLYIKNIKKYFKAF
jgi:hypothetical protein